VTTVQVSSEVSTVSIQTSASQVSVDAPQSVVQLQTPSISAVSVAEQGPPGTVPQYTHTQSSSSDTWTVNHNLGFRPAVTLLDSGGVEFSADVVHTSINQCIIYLASPTTGTVRCN
jgi:hypothetical protein